MPQSSRETADSKSQRTPTESAPKKPVRAGSPPEFDVDSWEPSLLERMLKASGAKRKPGA